MASNSPSAVLLCPILEMHVCIGELCISYVDNMECNVLACQIECERHQIEQVDTPARHQSAGTSVTFHQGFSCHHQH